MEKPDGLQSAVFNKIDPWVERSAMVIPPLVGASRIVNAYYQSSLLVWQA